MGRTTLLKVIFSSDDIEEEHYDEEHLHERGWLYRADQINVIPPPIPSNKIKIDTNLKQYYVKIKLCIILVSLVGDYLVVTGNYCINYCDFCISEFFSNDIYFIASPSSY